jgi:two-component system sensor histidine kinase/response regulator
MEQKERVIVALERAHRDLEQALADLHDLPAFDPDTIFLAAHAIRNLLHYVGAATDRLLPMLTDRESEATALVQALRHAAALMTHVVSLLTNTTSTSEVKLRWEKVDLGLLLMRACAFYKATADDKQIHIVCDPDDDLPPIWSDRVALAAVLDNLLSNAVKYSPQGRKVLVSVRPEPAHLVCVVKDEGPGFSLEDRLRLFQPGVRLSAVPTGGEPAAGYGLAVAKMIMTRVGGEIWCESEPGAGAAFFIRLPRYDARFRDFPSPAGTNAPPSSSEPPGS